jgi:hypothetical protein
LKEFASRFLDGYAKANRLKPSGIASKETVLRVHLAKAFGDKRLDEISTEEVQRLKAALTERAKDGEQHPDDVERRAEDGRRMGRDRTRPVLDQVAEDAEVRGHVSRL